jgi:hypothetical protein
MAAKCNAMLLQMEEEAGAHTNFLKQRSARDDSVKRNLQMVGASGFEAPTPCPEAESWKF